MAQGERKRAARTSRRDGRTVIDDTLASAAVFQMESEQILDADADPEGIRLGDQVADAILRQLKATGRVPRRK